MITKAQFSTCPDSAYGGLLICGMNWGGNTSDPTAGETESAPWAPLFSHPENYSKFQSPLLTWFSLWGHPLSYENPTELDRAIAQSNVFFDQSPRFLQSLKAERWTIALNRLAGAIEELHFSGVLLVSTKVVDRVVWLSARGDIPKWAEVIGNLVWDAPKYRRLHLRFGLNGTRLVAGISHPSSGVAHADVAAAKAEMDPWLRTILRRYKDRTEQRNLAYM